MSCVVLIPAYEPDEKLLLLLRNLVQDGVRRVVVVNDGSSPSRAGIVSELEKTPECRVVTHATNLGKGRALKTGFNFICLNYPDAPGIITADADGQHSPASIRKVQEAFLQNPSQVVLGGRAFDHDVPLRSKVGNIATRWIFNLIAGTRLVDTQTGLRAIPLRHVRDLMKIHGEKYEFEISMLLFFRNLKIPMKEVPIETIYIDNNRSSHFNPLLDSMRIYYQLLRFGLSSAISVLVDYLIFLALLEQLGVAWAMGVARLGAVGVNFTVNRKLVFKSRSAILPTITKYLFLVAFTGTLAFLGIRTLNSQLGISVVVAKILMESGLFIASFAIQRDFVFSAREELDAND